jgi:hypothetical protein
LPPQHSNALRNVINVEVATKINDIRNAAPDQRVRVGFVIGLESDIGSTLQ